MVQGKTKGLQHKASSSRHAAKAAAKTKKGQRHIAPKQPGLVKQATLHQSLSAKINRSVERQMVDAASSGKLTIMRNLGSGESSASSSKKKPKP